jgi:alkylation response protein AidB-like acyl-CoA dehydrogenase
LTARAGVDYAERVIDLRPSAEDDLVRETARAFARDRLLPGMRAHEARGAVDLSIVSAYRALGFATMEVPEAAGGQGLPPFAKILVLEELGAGDPGAVLALEGAGPALQALVELGALDLVRRLPEDPALRVAFVHDAAGLLASDGTTVSGTHPWAPLPEGGGPVVIVQPGRLLLVRTGVEVTPIRACGLAASGAAELGLAGAPVAAVVADRGAVARALAHARRWTAAVLVGAARAACEYAVRYAREREAFGRPIAHHQGLAFLLTDMATAVDVARLMVWRAAMAGADGAREAAWALAEAAEQALFVGPNAVQVLGGHGFMTDHPVEKWMRDIRTLAQLAGGRDEAEIDAAACEAVG